MLSQTASSNTTFLACYLVHVTSLKTCCSGRISFPSLSIACRWPQVHISIDGLACQWKGAFGFILPLMGMFAFDSTDAETKTNVHAGQCAMTVDCKTHHINADATMSCRLHSICSASKTLTGVDSRVPAITAGVWTPSLPLWRDLSAFAAFPRLPHLHTCCRACTP